MVKMDPIDVVGCIATFVVAVVGIIFLLLVCGFLVDNCASCGDDLGRDNRQRIGMRVFVDHGTGYQYFYGRRLTPRIGVDGKHMKVEE